VDPNPTGAIWRSLQDLAALGVVDFDQGEREVWRADYWGTGRQDSYLVPADLVNRL